MGFRIMDCQILSYLILEQRYLIFTGYAVEAYLMKNMDIHRLVRLKESIGGHILRFRFKPKPKIFR